MRKILLLIPIVIASCSNVMGQVSDSANWAPVQVLITNFENIPQKGEQIIFEGLKSKLVYKGVSDSDGKLEFLLKGGETYLIKIKSIGDADDYNKIENEILDKAIKAVTSDYCILVIPLLAKRETYPNVSRILVVDVDPETQISRLMARDKCSRTQAEQALKSQISREDRLKIADDVLDNSGSPTQVLDEVVKLHNIYTGLATGT